MSERQYCVYIMTNEHHMVFYIGVTNDLQRRVLEHRGGKSNVTKKHNITRLVYLECGNDIEAAILREKQIKAGSRSRKVGLIERSNPDGRDLHEEYFEKTNLH